MPEANEYQELLDKITQLESQNKAMAETLRQCQARIMAIEAAQRNPNAFLGGMNERGVDKLALAIRKGLRRNDDLTWVWGD